MKSVAERFYERSHKQYQEQDPSQGHVTLAELAQRLSHPTHRYYSVLNFLKTHPNLSVVELGFGDPGFASCLAAHAAAYRIIDVVDRRNGKDMPSNVAFTKADLNDDFPIGDSGCDCVVAMMVIEHLFDPFHSFHEVKRIVRPGGTIFINLPNVASLRCRLQLLAGKMPVTSSQDWFERREWDGNHLHYFTKQDVMRLAEDAGLNFVALYPVGGKQWLKHRLPTVFCHEISYEFSRPL